MSIISRIRRAESLMPHQSPGAVILREPPSDATDEAVAAFASAMVAEQSTGHSVIVVRNGTNRLRRPCVTYAANEFEAQLAAAATTPDDVYGDKLRAILANCKTGLPIVREVSDGEI